jgi:hypothetical protein
MTPAGTVEHQKHASLTEINWLGYERSIPFCWIDASTTWPAVKLIAYECFCSPPISRSTEAPGARTEDSVCETDLRHAAA